MKYYAVTEDPNELFHYGRKGMKWGKHIFGDKPKSPGYHRAVNKLKSIKSDTKKSLKKTVVAAKKTSAQIAENRRKHQEQMFERAVQNAQKRTEKMNSLYKLDAIKQQNKALQKQNREAQREIRAEYRQAHKDQKFANKVNRLQRQIDNRAYLSQLRGQNSDDKRFAKSEKHMEKYMQQAREGRLKYGKLTDDQVSRVQERLLLEQNARRLGNTEKTSFMKDLRGAVRKGVLEGVTKGIGAGMEEVGRAKAQTFILSRGAMKKKARQDAEIQKERQRIMNKKTKKEIRDEVKNENYEMMVREGVSAPIRAMYGSNLLSSTSDQAKMLNSLKEQKSDREYKQIKDREMKYLDERHERDRIRNIQDKIANERDETYYRLESETGKSFDELRDEHRAKIDKLKGKDDVDRFDALTEKEQKQEMVKDRLADAYEEYQKMVDAVNDYNDKVKQIDDEYDAKMKQYEKDYNNYLKGKTTTIPPLPKRDPYPNKPKEWLDYEQYSALSGFGQLRLPRGTNNGGGKGNKKN